MKSQVPEAVRKLLKPQGDRALLDLVRGRTVKDTHFPGLLQQQHPHFFCVPWGSERSLALGRWMPEAVSNVADERVARVVIDCSWNFNKSAEFVTWNHFLKGKRSSSSGEVLTAPARVAASTLSKCFVRLESSGLVYTLHLDLLGKVRIFYAPNPIHICNGIPFGHHADREKYGPQSTYGHVCPDITLMSESTVAYFTGVLSDQRSRFMRTLARELQRPERIAMLFTEQPCGLADLIAARREIRTGIDTVKEKHDGLLPTATVSSTQAREADLDEEEEEWFCLPEVRNVLNRLRAINCTQGEALAKGAQLEDPWAAEILLHRWGYALSTLSPSVWRALWCNRKALSERHVAVLEEIAKFTEGTWIGELQQGSYS